MILDPRLVTHLQSLVVVLFTQKNRQMAELEELNLGEVDLEAFADIEDLPDDLVR